jgi:hypothetical protein
LLFFIGTATGTAQAKPSFHVPVDCERFFFCSHGEALMRPDGSFNRLHAKAAELKAIRKPERIIDRRGETGTDLLRPPDREPFAPPPVPIDRSALSPAEKLEANLSTALDRQAEVMALGVDPRQPQADAHRFGGSRIDCQRGT